MPFDYKAAEVKPGKTVKLVLDMLPGAPAVHLEHLGESNKSYWSESVAKANSGEIHAGTRPKVITAKAIADRRVRDRELLRKHVIRKLEAKHADGSDATLDDVGEWLEAIPAYVLDMLVEYAVNPANFGDAPVATDVDATAEK